MFFYLSVECPTADAQFLCHQGEVALMLLDGGCNRVPFDFFEGSPLPSSPKGEGLLRCVGLLYIGLEVFCCKLHPAWFLLPFGGGWEGAHEQCPFHQVLQFADVAVEGEALEVLDGFGRGGRDG